MIHIVLLANLLAKLRFCKKCVESTRLFLGVVYVLQNRQWGFDSLFPCYEVTSVK
jgi:hypothetical protein